MDQRMPQSVVREFRVHIAVHQPTGMRVGLSDDLPGLLIHGRSDDDIIAKAPGAVREILEAQGHRIAGVTALPESALAGSFAGLPLIVNAEMLPGA
jgi:hypothetical protein